MQTQKCVCYCKREHFELVDMSERQRERQRGCERVGLDSQAPSHPTSLTLIDLL